METELRAAIARHMRERLHHRISYIKSGVRLAAGAAFVIGGWHIPALVVGSLLYMLAEIGGILEEVYGA